MRIWTDSYGFLQEMQNKQYHLYKTCQIGVQLSKHAVGKRRWQLYMYIIFTTIPLKSKTAHKVQKKINLLVNHCIKELSWAFLSALLQLLCGKCVSCIFFLIVWRISMCLITGGQSV